MARIFTRRETGDWLVISAEGLFDGTPGGWDLIDWRLGPGLHDVRRVEAFVREYFHPGLLAEILAGRAPQPPRSMLDLDRRQPEVAIRAPELASGSRGRMARIEVEVREAPPGAGGEAGSGARDVRLFRNGSLVKAWRGDVLPPEGGSVTLDAELPLVEGANRLTAYAFNRDDVKSRDAELVLTRAADVPVRPVAYVLAVGIDVYANRAFDLGYAVADARALGAELGAQQSALGRYDEVKVIHLLNEEATGANIGAALGRLGGAELPPGAPPQLGRLAVAQSEDVVVVFYAGHGVARGGPST